MEKALEVDRLKLADEQRRSYNFRKIVKTVSYLSNHCLALVKSQVGGGKTCSGEGAAQSLQLVKLLKSRFWWEIRYDMSKLGRSWWNVKSQTQDFHQILSRLRNQVRHQGGAGFFLQIIILVHILQEEKARKWGTNKASERNGGENRIKIRIVSYCFCAGIRSYCWEIDEEHM